MFGKKIESPVPGVNSGKITDVERKVWPDGGVSYNINLEVAGYKIFWTLGNPRRIVIVQNGLVNIERTRKNLEDFQRYTTAFANEVFAPGELGHLTSCWNTMQSAVSSVWDESKEGFDRITDHSVAASAMTTYITCVMDMLIDGLGSVLEKFKADNDSLRVYVVLHYAINPKDGKHYLRVPDKSWLLNKQEKNGDRTYFVTQSPVSRSPQVIDITTTKLTLTNPDKVQVEEERNLDTPKETEGDNPIVTNTKVDTDW